jgi:hypothetical protein
MKHRTLWIGVVIALIGSACIAENGSGRRAMTCAVREAVFIEPMMVTLKSMPPKFRLSLKQVMPSAGWSFDVDSVEVDAAAHRIVARVTVRRPEGMSAQVMTPTYLRLALGVLDPGRYFLELHSRDDPTQTHQPAQAFVLDAQ